MYLTFTLSETKLADFSQFTMKTLLNFVQVKQDDVLLDIETETFPYQAVKFTMGPFLRRSSDTAIGCQILRCTFDHPSNRTDLKNLS